MKGKLFIIILIFGALGGQAQTGDLTVLVGNITEVKGHVQLGLFNKKKGFAVPGNEIKIVRFKVTSKKMKYTFKDLTPGDYALAIYHDANSDKKCNRNLLGIPTEKYGFSNNVKPFLSAPSFEDTKVKLDENKSIMIKLL